MAIFDAALVENSSNDCCLYYVFQQFVGINTVIYYSPKIFLMAGFESTLSAIWASVGIGIVNVVFTVISLYLVDRIGRRKLYFIGLSGIAFSVLCLSACFIYANQLGEIGRWLMVIFMFGYVAFLQLVLDLWDGWSFPRYFRRKYGDWGLR